MSNFCVDLTENTLIEVLLSLESCFRSISAHHSGKGKKWEPEVAACSHGNRQEAERTRKEPLASITFVMANVGCQLLFQISLLVTEFCYAVSTF